MNLLMSREEMEFIRQGLEQLRLLHEDRADGSRLAAERGYQGHAEMAQEEEATIAAIDELRKRLDAFRPQYHEMTLRQHPEFWSARVVRDVEPGKPELRYEASGCRSAADAVEKLGQWVTGVIIV